MKVLHVYKFYRPVHGGGITAMASLIRGMGDNVESRALVATAPGKGRLEPGEESRIRRVASLAYWYSMPLAPSLPLWFAIDSRRVDIVHIHLPFPIADLSLSLFTPKVPVVLHWHSDIVQQVNIKRLLSPLLRRTLRRADRILVGSSQHVDYSEDLAPFRHKCEVVPYGIDVDQWRHVNTHLEKRIATLRGRYPDMVFFAGRLVAYKGLPTLLRAMQSIDGNLVIAGEGPMREQLEHLVTELGIGHKVHWVGELSDEELKAHYHACSVFTLPSIFRNEAFGLVQLEAMACGKPVVNTDLPSGVSWAARHDKEGITVSPEDVDSLSGAINRLLVDPALSARLGSAGYQRVNSVFNITNTSQQVYRIYRDLIAKSCAGAQSARYQESREA